MCKNLIKIILLFAVSPLFSQFSGGNGTNSSPYEIRTLQELENVRNYPDKHFILKRNIRDSLREPLYFFSNGNWKPFIGSFNGNGYKITLAMDVGEYMSASLFAGASDRAVIKNVIVDGYVKAGNSASGIVFTAISNNENDFVSVINCVNLAKIEASENSGIVYYWDANGIADKNINLATIQNSENADDMGGLVQTLWFGASYSLTVRNCINNGLLVDNSNIYLDCRQSGIGGIALGLLPRGGTIKVLNCLNTGVILVNGNKDRKKRAIYHLHSH
jgi:hypothetical protein